MSYEHSVAIPECFGYTIDMDGNVYSEAKQHDVRRLTMYTRGCNKKGPFVMMVIDGKKTTRHIPELLKSAYPWMDEDELSGWTDSDIQRIHNNIITWR